MVELLQPQNICRLFISSTGIQCSAVHVYVTKFEIIYIADGNWQDTLFWPHPVCPIPISIPMILDEQMI